MFMWHKPIIGSSSRVSLLGSSDVVRVKDTTKPQNISTWASEADWFFFFLHKIGGKNILDTNSTVK